MCIYSVNILSGCLLVMLQKALLLMYVVSLVYRLRACSLKQGNNYGFYLKTTLPSLFFISSISLVGSNDEETSYLKQLQYFISNQDFFQNR